MTVFFLIGIATVVVISARGISRLKPSPPERPLPQDFDIASGKHLNYRRREI